MIRRSSFLGLAGAAVAALLAVSGADAAPRAGEQPIVLAQAPSEYGRGFSRGGSEDNVQRVPRGGDDVRRGRRDDDDRWSRRGRRDDDDGWNRRRRFGDDDGWRRRDRFGDDRWDRRGRDRVCVTRNQRMRDRYGDVIFVPRTVCR